MSKKSSPPAKKHQPVLSSLKKTIKPNKTSFASVNALDDVPGILPTLDFPVVGIGASAGGLMAFEAFFSGMPIGVDPGMAFVVVQHLDPDHKSILTDLIRRYTRMQVFEVEDGVKVRPNCVYIIPPNRDMAFLNNTLQLMEPSAPRGLRLPIDFFFRSLAQDLHEHAICVVLSGTGSDGTLGVRAIKGEGGMVMAQNPESTEYDGMPRSAIGTGLVDYILPPAEMPAQIIAYVAHVFGRQPYLRSDAFPTPPKVANALKKIFILLRSQTGHDFSQYKPNTFRRRIERRMAVRQIETIEEYVRHLQQTPEEVEALFRDLLIGVTCFFRDPEAFKALEELVIPKLFAGRSTETAIRVWSPGCSTGEEAYSIAILLAEHIKTLKLGFNVQIFATDIDGKAISVARTGLYPASIASDISPERLKSFFTAEPDNSAYRIHKSIRDMLIFSEQDVIKDPPFSKIDLISCRNLLIYLNGDLQKKLLPFFYYALNPHGFLFLGTSETTGEFGDLFITIDRRLRLFRRKEDIHCAKRAALARFLPVMMSDRAVPPFAAKDAALVKLQLREVTEQALLRQVAPACALVNANGDMLYLHGRMGLYLEPVPGEVGASNILKMAREGLWRDLTTALHKAAASKEIVRHPGLRVKTNGDFTTVNLTVRPVTPLSDLVEGAGAAAASEPSLYLVILEEAPPFDSEPTRKADTLFNEKGADGADIDSDARIAALKQELRAKEEYLQATNEELETSNEELKSSNEELQSVNEEFQSTNEELETSKEELQSLNEELSTLNTELQVKLADLSRINNDMNNLLSGTGIGTVFVDHALRILRFTPAITRIINLIVSDIGRPVGHIVANLKGYESLVEDAQAVLDTLIPKEVEVQTLEGMWYSMRIMPYRTLDNVIEGAVITFVDINDRKLIEDVLKRNEKLLRTTQQLSRIGGWDFDAKKQISFWTEEMFRLHDFEPGELAPDAQARMARSLECYAPEDRPKMRSAFQQCVEKGRPFDLELRFISAKGRQMWIRTFAEAVLENGKVTRAGGFMMDITETKRKEEALQKALDDIRTLRGLLMICSNCKKIRDDKGRWDPIEVYIRDRTEADFSHGMCPECIEKLYPELMNKAQSGLKNDGDRQ